jgi:hypothetical protein
VGSLLEHLRERAAQGAEAMALLVEHDARDRNAPRREGSERDLLQIEVAIDEVRVMDLADVVVVPVIPEHRYDRPRPLESELVRESARLHRFVERVQRAREETRLLARHDREHPFVLERLQRRHHARIRLERCETHAQGARELGALHRRMPFRAERDLARRTRERERRETRALRERCTCDRIETENVGGQVLEPDRELAHRATPSAARISRTISRSARALASFQDSRSLERFAKRMAREELTSPPWRPRNAGTMSFALPPCAP